MAFLFITFNWELLFSVGRFILLISNPLLTIGFYSHISRWPQSRCRIWSFCFSSTIFCRRTICHRQTQRSEFHRLLPYIYILFFSFLTKTKASLPLSVCLSFYLNVIRLASFIVDQGSHRCSGHDWTFLLLVWKPIEVIQLIALLILTWTFQIITVTVSYLVILLPRGSRYHAKRLTNRLLIWLYLIMNKPLMRFWYSFVSIQKKTSSLVNWNRIQSAWKCRHCLNERGFLKQRISCTKSVVFSVYRPSPTVMEHRGGYTLVLLTFCL